LYGYQGIMALYRIMKKELCNFMEMFADSAFAVFITNTEGQIIDSNTAASELCGYDAAEIKGMNCRVIFGTANSMIKEMASDPALGAAHGEAAGTKRNGEIFWVSFSSTSITNEQEVTLVYSVLTNITQQKKETLELDLLLNNTSEAFILIGTDLRIKTFNNQFQQLYKKYFKLTLQKERFIVEYAQPERREAVTATYHRVLNGVTDHSELCIPSGEGVLLYFDLMYAPARDRDNNIVGIVVTARDITEDKSVALELGKRQHLLESMNQRWEKIMESSSDIICALNEKDIILQISAAVYPILGYTTAEMTGRSYLDFVYPADRDSSMLVSVEAIESNFPTNFENRYVSKDGSLVTIEWAARYDEVTQIIYAVGRDITQKKTDEAILVESEKKYKNLFENNPTPMFVWDLDSNLIIEGNEAALNKYEYTAAELMQMTLRDLSVQEDDVLPLQEKLPLDNTGLHKNVWLHKKKNGELMYMEAVGHMIEYKGKKAFLSLLNDITDQRKAEEEKEFEKRDKEALINTTSDLIWTVSRNFKLVAANQPFINAVYSMTGFTMKTGDYLLRKSIFPAEMLSLWRGCYSKALSGVAHKEQVHTKAAAGVKESWSEISFNPIYHDGTIEGIACYSRSITELKASEEKYKILFDQSPLPKWIYDLTTYRFLDVNITAIRLYGFSKEEFLRMSLADIRPESELHKLAETQLNSKNKNEVNHFGIFTHKKKNGTCIKVEVSGNMFAYEGRTCMMAVCNDVTIREQVLQQLEESNQRYNYVTKATSDAIWDWDVTTGRLFWGEGYNQLLGIRDENPEWHDLDSTLQKVHPADMSMMKRNAVKALKGKEMGWNYEFRYKKADGSYAFVFNKAFIVRNDAGLPVRVIGAMQDITQRKQAEIELQQAYNEKNTVLESIGDGFFAVDKNSTVTYWNNKAEILLSAKREDVIGRNLHEMFARPDSMAFHDHYMKAINENTTVHFEEFSNRSKKWFSVSAFASVSGLSVYFKDITQRKETEQIIIDSEEKRKLIMNAALDAIICMDSSGNITFWNPQAEVIFGWQEEEVMGQRLSGFIIPEPYRKRHDEGIAQYIKTGKANALNVLLELSAINRAGDEFPIELTVMPIKQGGDEFFCAFIRNISERKKAADAIMRSNERYDMVAKATNDSIWDWDLVTGTLSRTGDGFKTLFGYEIEEAAEDNLYWTKKVHPDDLGRIKEKHDKVFSDPAENYWEDEYRFKKACGEYAYVYDKGYILRDTAGNPLRMIGATQDVTKLRENEIRLKELNEQLAHWGKELAVSNAELEQFAYVASHDLQEPLRMITSFLTLLESKYGSIIDEKGKKYIDFAVDGARRMRQIILDLLEFSRVGRYEEDQEQVNLNEIIEEVQILYRRQVEDQQAIISSEKLPVITSYKGPMRQVFQNLLSNALKYTAAGVAPRVTIEVIDFEDHWQFSVADNGIGIGKEYFEKIFIIFQRLHNREAYTGTGMGLAVTKKIIENLGGKIWVDSVEFMGSTFYFSLPKKIQYPQKKNI
jgi:PAS domain S-box-containing protein